MNSLKKIVGIAILAIVIQTTLTQAQEVPTVSVGTGDVSPVTTTMTTSSGGGGGGGSAVSISTMFPESLPLQSMEALKSYLLETVDRIRIDINGDEVASNSGIDIPVNQDARGDAEALLRLVSQARISFETYNPAKPFSIFVSFEASVRSENGNGYGYSPFSGKVIVNAVNGKGGWTLPNDLSIELKSSSYFIFPVSSTITSAYFQEKDASGNTLRHLQMKVEGGFLNIPVYCAGKIGEVVLSGNYFGKWVTQKYDLSDGKAMFKEILVAEEGSLKASISGITTLVDPTSIQFRPVLGKDINQLFVIKMTKPGVITEATAILTGSGYTEESLCGWIRKQGSEKWEGFGTWRNSKVDLSEGVYYLFFYFMEVPFGNSGNSSDVPQPYYGEKG
ncbi:MAG: hypothetical protein WC666_01580 [Candidatus Paceibacterota bacterium]|jgi:hypothetical protein